MDRIYRYIPRDKLLHFAVGALAFIVMQTFVSEAVALLGVIVLGTGKEVYDHVTDSGVAEAADAYATMWGAIAALVLLEQLTIRPGSFL